MLSTTYSGYPINNPPHVGAGNVAGRKQTDGPGVRDAQRPSALITNSRGIDMQNTFKKSAWKSQSVSVDNAHFEECVFDECILVYAGGALPIFDRCSFKNARFKFSGAAGNTLEFLASMHNSFFRKVVEETFENIRKAAAQKPPQDYVIDSKIDSEPNA